MSNPCNAAPGKRQLEFGMPAVLLWPTRPGSRVGRTLPARVR